MIGAAAVGLDTFQLSLWKRQLQRMADSSALAGAYAVSQGRPANAAVTRDLQENNNLTLSTAAIAQNAPEVGPFTADMSAVRVVLSAQRTLPFWSMFQGSSPTVTVEATARAVQTGRFCLLSLENAGVAGITIGGNGQVRLGCGMATNSRAANGVALSGSADVVATPIAAMGGLQPNSRYVGGTQLLPYSEAQPDPFAYLANPNVPGGPCGAFSDSPGQTNNLSPGCYGGMDIKGNVNLAPGTYFVDGGSFSAGSQAVINGTGVTIVLTSRNAVGQPSSIASLSISAGATVNLSSPEKGTGPYAGVLIYQDRRAPLLNSMTINGNSTGKLEGAIYMPRASLSLNGGSGMDTKCLQLVTRRMSFSGDTVISNDCDDAGGSEAFALTDVRLVA
jgi:hypothetical protein